MARLTPGFRLGGALAPAPSIDEQLEPLAQYLFGPNSAADSDSNITTFSMTGTIGGMLTKAGTGTLVRSASGGVTFADLATLGSAFTAGPWEGALVLLDIQATANPLANGYHAQVATTNPQKNQLRRLSTGVFEMRGPGNIATTAGVVKGNGSRQVIGAITDPNLRILPSGGQGFVNADGTVTLGTPSSPANITAFALLFGEGLVGTIHRAAIFQIASGLPSTFVQDMWALMGGAQYAPFT